jgi:hypothetical protein
LAEQILIGKISEAHLEIHGWTKGIKEEMWKGVHAAGKVVQAIEI